MAQLIYLPLLMVKIPSEITQCKSFYGNHPRPTKHCLVAGAIFAGGLPMPPMNNNIIFLITGSIECYDKKFPTPHLRR